MRIFIFFLILTLSLYANNRGSINYNIKKIQSGDFGNYYALIIALQDYKYINTLSTPYKDAIDLKKVLEKKYGFLKAEILKDPNTNELLDKLDDYKNRLNIKDNLLIYYAGHGTYWEGGKKAYWQLKEAKNGRRSGSVTIDNAIKATLSAMRAKHILVISDSYYSGYLVRDSGSFFDTLNRDF